MKLNSRIASISVFLIMMLGAGIASAWWGFTIGHEALKGVSQPDVNPAKELNKNQQASAQSEEFKPVSEKEILTKVQAYINRQDTKPKPQTKKQTEQEQNPEEQTESQQPRQERTQTANFPLTVQDRGVTLEIVKVIEQGSALLLKVNLSNRGSASVQFLYSFLDVKDSQGHSLSAITDGLPGELPPTGEKFSGTITIPTALSAQSQTISLNLTDYPEQKLQLKIPDIAVDNKL